MNPTHDSDTRLHQALSEIGPALPEPAAPERLLERMSALAPNPRSRAPAAYRAGLTALAAATVALCAVSGVMLVENQRLRARLDTLDAGAPGAVLPASRALPPLVAVRFYHPQCPIAQAVAPRFEEIERSHPSEQVLFVSLDISESKESQSTKLAGALDCGFVFSCDGAPVTSGMVVLADTRSRQVIKASHDAADLGDLERALDEALVACAPQDPGD